MLYDETYFEESNFKRKPFIWSNDNKITRFGRKNGRLWFWEKCTKLHENEGKLLFDETYFEESNIKRKPLIWSQIR